MMNPVVDLFVFLAEHYDLIEDLVSVIRSGASKDSVRTALRDLKVEMSDQAMREELGFPPTGG
jgi:hypothetical protein